MTIAYEPAAGSPAIEDVAGIADAVWASYLGGPPDIQVVEQVPPADEDMVISGSVLVEGAWTGGVVISCGEQVAERLAAAMLGITDHVDATDVGDAMGELANVLGGNVKSLLPQPSAISLPIVSHGTRNAPAPEDARDVCLLHVTWHGSPITLRVWARP